MSESRLMFFVRSVVRELIANERVPFSFLIRYRVVKNTAGRVELQRVSKSRGYPDTLPISFQPGAGGHKATPALGSIVLVSFVEGDPSLPMVTHYARTDDAAFVPISSSLDASGTVRIGEHATLVHLGSGTDAPGDATGRVVCFGDTVAVGSTTGLLAPSGPTVAAVAKVKAR